MSTSQSLLPPLSQGSYHLPMLNHNLLSINQAQSQIQMPIQIPGVQQVSLITQKKKKDKKSPDNVSIDELKAIFNKHESRRIQQHEYYLQRKKKLQENEELKQMIAQLEALVIDQQKQIQQLQQK